MKKLLIFILLFLGVIGGAAFIPVSNQASRETPTVLETKELKLGVVGDIAPELSGDPTSAWRPYFRLIFEPLIEIQNDMIIPALASEWSESQHEASLTLRPGITFSDGRALTADDILKSIEYAKQNKLLPDEFFARYSDIKIDSDKVTFSFKESSKDFLPSLANLFIIERRAKEKNNQLIGTGPFIVQDDAISARDSYWGEKPLLRKLFIKIYLAKETTQLLADMRAGELNGMIINKEMLFDGDTAGFEEFIINDAVSLFLVKGYLLDTGGVFSLADIGTRAVKTITEEKRIPLYKKLMGLL